MKSLNDYKLTVNITKKDNGYYSVVVSNPELGVNRLDLVKPALIEAAEDMLRQSLINRTPNIYAQ